MGCKHNNGEVATDVNTITVEEVEWDINTIAVGEVVRDVNAITVGEIWHGMLMMVYSVIYSK